MKPDRLIPCLFYKVGSSKVIQEGIIFCSDDPYQKIDHPLAEKISISLSHQDLAAGLPIDCGDIVITGILEERAIPLIQASQATQAEPEIIFSQEKPYHRFAGSYIFLADGSVARLLKPTIVEGREYFNLVGIAPKTRRVSRRWIRQQIQKESSSSIQP